MSDTTAQSTVMEVVDAVRRFFQHETPGPCIPCMMQQGLGGKGDEHPNPKPKSACVPGLTSDQADKAVSRALKNQRKLLEIRKAQIVRWNAKDQANFKRWFGSTDEVSRQQIKSRIEKEIQLNKQMKLEDFKCANPSKPKRYAYVYPTDTSHTIYLDVAFGKAKGVGKDSQAGTLAHEMSHFNDIGGTKDVVYGTHDARDLAKTNPAKAQQNADSFEYYIEGVK